MPTDSALYKSKRLTSYLSFPYSLFSTIHTSLIRGAQAIVSCYCRTSARTLSYHSCGAPSLQLHLTAGRTIHTPLRIPQHESFTKRGTLTDIFSCIPISYHLLLCCGLSLYKYVFSIVPPPPIHNSDNTRPFHEHTAPYQQRLIAGNHQHTTHTSHEISPHHLIVGETLLVPFVTGYYAGL